MNKEEIYDEQISPLMSHIIKVCKEHAIDMHCTFFLPVEGNENLVCTTHIGLEENRNQEYRDTLDQMYNLVYPQQRDNAMMFTTRDANGEVVKSEVVLG